MKTKTQKHDETVLQRDDAFKNVSDSIKMTENRQGAMSAEILVGVVESFFPANDVERIPVRWRTYDGQQIRRNLLFMDGLQLQEGDQVVLGKPQNFPEPIVTGVLKRAVRHNVVAKTDATPVVTVDGKRLEITGEDEIVLRCGDSSITMRRNGRIVIKGKYVESRSAGTNRVKGGSVLIN